MMDLKKVEKVLKLMAQHDVHEIELSDGKDLIRVQRGQPATHVPVVTAPIASVSESTPASKADSSVGSSTGIEIQSPFVGTFYRAPSPGADVFVSEGQSVKKGDTLCIVEAMKLMNEIEAENDGVISKILVHNEEPVEFEQPLFILEPNGGTR